jgi:multicomponent Na+:H+ antiporter subunit E
MYVLFFLLWIIFNGRVTFEIVIFGLVISAAIYWFVCKFMDLSPKRELDYLKKGGYILQYIFVLIGEIVKANFATMKLVCSSNIVTEPVLVQFDTDFKSDTSKFMLANAITLTPGTITVSVEGNKFTVHCLDKSLAEGINTSVFVDILHKIEK